MSYSGQSHPHFIGTWGVDNPGLVIVILTLLAHGEWTTPVLVVIQKKREWNPSEERFLMAFMRPVGGICGSSRV